MRNGKWREWRMKWHRKEGALVEEKAMSCFKSDLPFQTKRFHFIPKRKAQVKEESVRFRKGVWESV